MNKIIITTYIGMSCEATHYYGYLWISNPCDQIELQRPITEAEINSNKDRFYAYKVGDLTNCFPTWKEVIAAGKEKASELGLSVKDIVVCGIPNNDEMSLDKALSDGIDTRLKCSHCGKPIKGGFYNYPSGAMCMKCFKKIKK